VDDTDEIVRVDAVTICGTDLHILKGALPRSPTAASSVTRPPEKLPARCKAMHSISRWEFGPWSTGRVRRTMNGQASLREEEEPFGGVSEPEGSCAASVRDRESCAS